MTARPPIAMPQSLPAHDGEVTLAVQVDGVVRDVHDDAAFEDLARLLIEARHGQGMVWIDLSDPSAAQVARAAELL